jgi:hypothetical protein
MQRRRTKLVCALAAAALAIPSSVMAITIKFKVKIKIGDTTIVSTKASANVPVGGGTATIDAKVSPIPTQTQVSVNNTPLLPTLPNKATSELFKAAGPELGKLSGNIIREAGIGYANMEREVKKGSNNAATELRKAAADTERSLRKSGDDVGRELKATQREVEGAATAVYRFTIRQAESSVDAVQAAERRFREGKVIDAVWHLSLAPAQSTNENAARAAIDSPLLNTVMSSAASVYGGPGGAAAYAAWLTYYQTGGDVNAALRVGLTAAVKSYGAQYAQAPNPATAGFAESFKHAATGGAMNGLAVAASGGSAADVQKAMIATAGAILVQDGYQSLSHNPAVAEFAQKAKQVYCVKALVDRAEDKSCPSMKDYLKDAQGRVAMLDTKGLVQYVDMAKEIPGSDWLFLSREEAMTKASDAFGVDLDKLPVKEIDAKVKAAMMEVKKVKGANIVSLLEDRWALSFEPGRAVEGMKASVAPAVLLSYTGISPTKVDAAKAEASKVLNAALPVQPQEIVSCHKGMESARIWVAKGQPGDDLQCVVGQQLNEAPDLGAAWYARKDGSFCQAKMLDEAKELVAKGFTCAGR